MSKSDRRQGDWSSTSESLFRAARADHDASASDRARVRTALAQRLAAQATAASTFPGVAQAMAKKSTSLGKLAWFSLGTACVVAGSVALMHSARPVRAPEVPVRLPPAPLGREIAPPPALSESSEGKVEEPPRSRVRSQISAPATRPRTPAEPASATGRSSLRGSTRQPDAQQSSPPRTQRASTAARVVPDGSDSQVASERPTAAAEGSTSAAETTKQPTGEAEQRSVPTSDQHRSGARAELALVAKIHAAMRTKDLPAALALCAQHERYWPDGTFSVEREGVRALAACSLRSPDAEQRARAFVAAHPRTPLALSVAAGCLAPAPAPTKPETTPRDR